MKRLLIVTQNGFEVVSLAKRLEALEMRMEARLTELERAVQDGGTRGVLSGTSQETSASTSVSAELRGLQDTDDSADESHAWNVVARRHSKDVQAAQQKVQQKSVRTQTTQPEISQKKKVFGNRQSYSSLCLRKRI